MTEMAQTGHPYRRETKLEWRNGFNRVRFYHAKHGGSRDRAHFPNPRYVALVSRRLCGLLDRLPTGAPADPEADARELAALIDSADAAFSDPVPEAPAPKPRRKQDSFGYDVYLVHGQDFEEFDLDRAIVQALRDSEAA